MPKATLPQVTLVEMLETLEVTALEDNSNKDLVETTNVNKVLVTVEPTNKWEAQSKDYTTSP
jgi:divalent metal cation (Fe/Co/Zn/Cd) transporter